MQTKLSFMEDLPVPQTAVWEQLENEQKRAVIDLLARVTAKMIVAEKQSGEHPDG